MGLPLFIAWLLPFATMHAPAGPPEPLRSGPMLGWIDARQTVIWLQTTRPADVQVRYFPGARPEEARLTPVLRTSAEDDLIALVDLEDLEPGTRYGYELYLDGRLAPRPYPLAFATRPLARFREEPPAFSAMVGSCLYVNDPAYDAPGRGFGSDYEIFGAMAAQAPDLMIWLGDNAYLRGIDHGSPSGIRRRHAQTRALPELQAFLAATPHYATWDDHDFGPNDGDGSYGLKDAALEAFARYFPAPARGLRDVPGVFHGFTWADAEFFLLDDRYHRRPNRWPQGPDKRMLGLGQTQWLKEGLVASRAAFKIVVLGNQALNPLAVNEGLIRYPAERDEILDWIRAQRIEGVLFVSGDRHWSELIRLQLEGLYPLYDFTSSALTAGVFRPQPGTAEHANPHRVPGTLLDEHGFGVLRFEGQGEDRRVRLMAFDRTGALRWEHAVARRELAFP